jgi:hypothetical protein
MSGRLHVRRPFSVVQPLAILLRETDVREIAGEEVILYGPVPILP